MISPSNTYRFSKEIRDVAIIGAGISGVASAAHLLRHGLNVTVFERSNVVGGVWHYDSRAPIEPPYPNMHPSAPDGNNSEYRSVYGHGDGEEPVNADAAALVHAPPGPCYNGLRNNIPTPVMRTTLIDWPEDTPDYISHDKVEQYIQDLAFRTGAHDRIQYSTRVESVRKNALAGDTRWTIHTQTLRSAGDREHHMLKREWSFDAVIVATGRYHEPRIPDVPGLKKWKGQLPNGILHSKSYRSPEPFRNKRVFLIGSGVSALDIAREVVGVAKETYQSARNGKFDLPAGMFAPGVKRVGPVDSFVHKTGTTRGQVVLVDGHVVDDVDVVILCTGYITSYPFLGQLQAPDLPKEDADDNTIITSDGCITHNLHKDIFYIPDPTLAFVGVPYHASAFSLFDFQAAVVARVLSGLAELPSQEQMRIEYNARKAHIAEGGAAFHSLMKRDVEYMKELQGWVNIEAARLGHKPMSAIDDRWVDRYHAFVEEMNGRRWASPGEVQDIPFVGEALRDSRVVVSA